MPNTSTKIYTASLFLLKESPQNPGDSLRLLLKADLAKPPLTEAKGSYPSRYLPLARYRQTTFGRGQSRKFSPETLLKLSSLEAHLTKGATTFDINKMLYTLLEANPYTPRPRPTSSISMDRRVATDLMCLKEDLNATSVPDVVVYLLERGGHFSPENLGEIVRLPEQALPVEPEKVTLAPSVIEGLNQYKDRRRSIDGVVNWLLDSPKKIAAFVN